MTFGQLAFVTTPLKNNIKRRQDTRLYDTKRKDLFATLNKNALSIVPLCSKCHYAECRVLFIVMLCEVMLNVIMLRVLVLSVVMLSVVMLSVVILSVVMLSVVILSVVMLSVIMLSIVTPILQNL